MDRLIFADQVSPDQFRELGIMWYTFREVMRKKEGRDMIRLEMNTPVIRSLVRGRQPEIASALGIAVTSFSRKINGKQRVYLDEVNRLADVLGVDAPTIVRFLPDSGSNGEP